jgi:predicted transcriptional regulator of viral defense system
MSADQLFDIIDHQQGYFTAAQIASCGIPTSSVRRKVVSGEWIREQRGMYRLARYPLTDRPELVVWSLWSQNRKGAPQGVWSHETALDIHDLGDLMPAKMHMTVPRGFRRRCTIPPVLQLHYENLAPEHVEQHQGFCVTTVLKTLIDLYASDSYSVDFIAEAIEQALREGSVSRRQIFEGSEQLKGVIDEYNI